MRATVYALCCLLALSSPLSYAQSAPGQPGEPAGQVVLVNGEVVARNTSGGDRSLSRRDAIFEGDTLLTAADASAQIRMVDGALISLKADTTFVIVAYQYEQDVANDVSTLELVEGGFRTISGSIGSQNREAYEARIANFATIGIRGTDYEVVITPECNLLTGVYDSGTTITNASGELDLGVGANFDFAEIPDPQSPPAGLLQQPEELGNIPIVVANNTPPTPPANVNAAGNAAGTDSSPPSAAIDLPPPSPYLIASAPVADVVGDQLATQQLTKTSAIVINPVENHTDTSVSCAKNSNACVKLTDGRVIDNRKTGDNEPSNTNNPRSNSFEDSVTSNAGGNSTGNSGNSNTGGNSNSGSSGNSNSGTSGNSDNTNTSGSGSGGSSGNSNSGNSGNSNSGNSGNSGNGGNSNSGSGSNSLNPGKSKSGIKGRGGNSDSVNVIVESHASNEDRISRPNLSTDDLGILWGRWDATLDENWAVLAQSDSEQMLISAGDYFAKGSPTDIAQLTGSHHYSTTIASSFIGSGSAGNVSSVVASMNVDFAAGSIANGSLQLAVADQVWAVLFGGITQNGSVVLNVGSGTLTDSSGLVSNVIKANLNGAFTGPGGEAFVGGFDLLDQLNPFNSVQGLYSIDRQ